jgi:hypothetical protein
VDQAKSGTKLKLTQRALMQRINRKLARNHQKLSTVRSAGHESNVGRYFILNVSRNVITETNIELEKLGRRLGVFKEWEELAMEA